MLYTVQFRLKGSFVKIDNNYNYIIIIINSLFLFSTHNKHELEMTIKSFTEGFITVVRYSKFFTSLSYDRCDMTIMTL